MTTILAFCHALGRETTVPFPSIRLTALVIAQHCKPLSGDGAYPALRTIAKKCGLSKSTVHRAVGWLTAQGWLEITPETGFGQGWRRHRYKLAIPHALKPKRVPSSVGHVSGRTPFKKNLNGFKEQPTGDKSPKTPSTTGNSAAAGHWRAVLEAIQRVGRYRLPDLPPEVLAAIRQIGGWGSICGSMEFDLRPYGPVYARFAAALAGS
ncbi:MAG TPA: helix-turn-helix domain-containing protein [Candidatus Competibacter sp.]|nr:helix-turn-helix domain-containing protein [Candidatus Competibacter sp.]HRW66200.1 helix-turn-helix domain-containing protein [Candidatus Competibacter sp.]